VLRRLKSELAEQMVTKSHKMHEVRGRSMHECLSTCIVEIMGERGLARAMSATRTSYFSCAAGAGSFHCRASVLLHSLA
jgi:hypothetical protein